MQYSKQSKRVNSTKIEVAVRLETSVELKGKKPKTTTNLTKSNRTGAIKCV